MRARGSCPWSRTAPPFHRALRACCLLAVAVGCEEPPPRAIAAVPPYAGERAPLVDPFIGTSGEGYTFPGATAPWGMVAVSPRSRYRGVKDFLLSGEIAPAGYRFGDRDHFGVGHTHLSGVGCPDLGAPVLVATVGEVRTDPAAYRSTVTREVAWPGYYAAELGEAGVLLESTATPRAGVTRLGFPAGAGSANVLVDASTSLSWTGGRGMVRVLADDAFEGWTETGFFCAQPNAQRVYFAGRLSRPATTSGTWRRGELGEATEEAGEGVGAFFRFTGEEALEVEVRVGISYVSTEGARRNLEAELAAGGDFEAVRAATFAAWERELSRIRVSGGTDRDRRIFYTALYHALLHPSLLADVDGQHPTMGGGPIATTAGRERYHVFSLWDTYRTLHPLLTLVYPERQAAMLRSLTEMARESGRPPKWELAGYEVNMMVGDPLLPVLADAAAKGLDRDLDLAGLYPILREGAFNVDRPPLHRPGNAAYWELGFIPTEEEPEVWGPVSTTLEYAYADWALARLARRLGEGADADRLVAQAGVYAHLFDGERGVFRSRRRDGSWVEPFDPETMQGSRGQPNSGGPGYVEGNAWHYAFFVPHDVAGLIGLHGGAGPFVEHLQRLFDADRFTLWNEPDMAFPYLFTHVAGESWRTQREVDRARTRFFGDGPDGLPGNDDAGTLSAWYLFSAMGLYPDCPGTERYSLTSPLFDRVEIQLSPAFHQGATFVIEAPRLSPQHIYVRGMTLGDVPHEEPFLTHAQITAGGRLTLELGDQPP